MPLSSLCINAASAAPFGTPPRRATPAATARTSAAPNLRQRQHRRRWVAVAGAWREATDPDTGKSYYWNQETEEVAWDLPAGAEVETAPGEDGAGRSPATEVATDPGGNGDGGPSYAEMLEELMEAATSDPNRFGSVANGFRAHGVFSVEFMDHLDTEMKAARGDAERGEALQKVQARIANPLLRQGEFF